MYTILIVDDEKLFSQILTESLKRKPNLSECQFFTAENGRKAVKILENESVDLVITDLRMPEMNGLELLAYINNNFKGLPIIVTSGYGTPEIEKRLNAIKGVVFMNKPVDHNLLYKHIMNFISSSSRGKISGISLPSFLQLLEVEKNTCTLYVRSLDKYGKLYFMDGILMNAKYGDEEGISAAYKIISWNPVEMSISPVCSEKERKIDKDLGFILMESMRLYDENEDSPAELALEADEEADDEMNLIQDTLDDISKIVAEGLEPEEIDKNIVKTEKKILSFVIKELKNIANIKDVFILDKNRKVIASFNEKDTLKKWCFDSIIMADDFLNQMGYGNFNFMAIEGTAGKVIIIKGKDGITWIIISDQELPIAMVRISIRDAADLMKKKK